MSIEGRLYVMKDFVINLAKLSKCTERQVAAIITDTRFNQVYSIGINGGAKGQEDCMCITGGKYGCIHAEINALIKCNNFSEDKVMFITLAPCKQCAAAIINMPGSFKAVYIVEAWKDKTGINMLEEAGIKVYYV